MERPANVQHRAFRAARRLLAGRGGDVMVARAVELVGEAQMPLYRNRLPLLEAELARARRYRRPLTLASVELRRDRLPEPLEHVVEGTPGRTGRYFLVQTKQLLSFAFGLILEEALRQSDFLGYVPSADRFVLLLPESDREQAQRAVLRIDELLHRRLALHLRAGVAAFPGDGLTLEELVAAADREIADALDGLDGDDGGVSRATG